MAFFINEFFVCLLNAMLCASSIFYHFDQVERSNQMIHRAVQLTKTFDTAGVSDIIISSMKVFMFYGKLVVERGQ